MSSNGSQSPVVPTYRPRGRSRNSLVIQLSAFALTFILVALLVVTSSRAAFVAQNDNSTNQVTAAAITLTDTDSGTAMFNNVTGLMPGTTEERCIDVTYTGTVDPTAVMLFASGTPTGTLSPYLDVTIQMGVDSTPVFRDCTGFVSSGTLYTGTLANFASTRTNYSNGLTTWNPAGTGETRTFRVAISVQDNNAAAGLTTTFGFTWETRTS